MLHTAETLIALGLLHEVRVLTFHCGRTNSREGIL